jgi:hypothetical protein
LIFEKSNFLIIFSEKNRGKLKKNQTGPVRNSLPDRTGPAGNRYRLQLWLYSPYQTAYVVKISEPYPVLVTRYRENNLNKEFIKIFQTNKNQFWVLLMRFSYLSQKNRSLYKMVMFSSKSEKFDWARSGVALVQWLLRAIAWAIWELWLFSFSGQNIRWKIKTNDKYRLCAYNTYQYISPLPHLIKWLPNIFLCRIDALSKSYEMHDFDTIFSGLIIPKVSPRWCDRSLD